MADSANPADGRPSPPSASSDANGAAPRPAAGGPSEKLPLLTFLGRQNLRSAGADDGCCRSWATRADPKSLMTAAALGGQEFDSLPGD